MHTIRPSPATLRYSHVAARADLSVERLFSLMSVIIFFLSRAQSTPIRSEREHLFAFAIIPEHAFGVKGL
jgi:hypothetical protein